MITNCYGSTSKVTRTADPTDDESATAKMRHERKLGWLQKLTVGPAERRRHERQVVGADPTGRIAPKRKERPGPASPYVHISPIHVRFLSAVIART